MPRTRTPRKGGKMQEFDKQDAYLKERTKKSLGRFMRTFEYSKQSEIVSTYDDEDYLVIYGLTPNTAGGNFLADAVTRAYELGASVNNLKEEVAGQKTAFEDTCGDVSVILLNLIAQGIIKKLMANPPRSDATSDFGTGLTTTVSVACFEESTYADILTLLKDQELPDCIVQVVKLFSFYFKTHNAWNAGENHLPDRYFMWFAPLLSAADMKTIINDLRGNQAKTKMHAQKFGLKLTTFSEGMLNAEECPVFSTKAATLFSVLPLVFRNTGDTADKVYKPTYPFDADVSESRKIWFKDDPNEEPLNAFLKLLHPNEGTYNKYGGLFGDGELLPSGSDMIGVRADYTEGTEFLGTTLTQQIDIILLLYATYCNDTNVALEFQGTEVANAIIKSGVTQITWPLANMLDMKYATGLDEIMSDAILVNYLRKQMFGG